MKLYKILEKIQNDNHYIELDDCDKNIFESYVLMGELLNPNNSYKYEQKYKGYFVFEDNQGYNYFVRIVYQPTKEPYFEIKMGWVDLEGDSKYLKQSEREIDERRSDTIAKIYRDEILPFFISQDKSNVLKIKPLDIKRYQFSIRLVKKFKNDKIEILENQPNEIILTKMV